MANKRLIFNCLNSAKDHLKLLKEAKIRKKYKIKRITSKEYNGYLGTYSWYEIIESKEGTV